MQLGLWFESLPAPLGAGDFGRTTMRNFLLAAATATMAFGGLALSGSAQAAPVGIDALRHVSPALNLIEDVQYRHRGRQYCWYNDGWRGPGFYWCGYAWRQGRGWGGGRGWQGWGVAPAPRYYRDRDFDRRRYNERRDYRGSVRNPREEVTRGSGVRIERSVPDGFERGRGGGIRGEQTQGRTN